MTETSSISYARLAGRLARGALIGLLLIPALCGLIAIAGDISPFAYQGY
jgi:hypothetical protein